METELMRTRVQELEGLRETNAETCTMRDGTYECVVYAEDKYYWDDSGDWLAIDNSIVPLSTATVVQENGYDDGVRYYLISKSLIIDYPHCSGHETALKTQTTFLDRAGDTIDKSTTVTGSVQLGKFDYPGDVDCYVFTPSSTGTYSLGALITNASATGFDLDMVVYNTYGNILLSDTDIGKPEINIAMTAGTKYFIRIVDSGRTVNPYEFTYILQ